MKRCLAVPALSMEGPMDKVSTRRTIDAIYAARIAGDTLALRAFLAPKAAYEMVGARAFANKELVGPADAASAADRLVNDFRFHTLETVNAVIDGHQAAVVNRIGVSFRGGDPVQTEACDVWEFDADGKVTSLRQFVDTDLLRQLIGQSP